MYTKRFEDTPSFVSFGNEYHMLLPRDETECTEAALVRIKRNSFTPSHAHPEEEQIYFILEGMGRLKVAGQEGEVKGGTVVFIPRNAEHEITCTSDEDLIYIYVAVWPGGIPKEQKSWRKAYSKLQQPDTER